MPHWKETLPNGVAHEIIQKDGDNGYWSNTPVYTVPPDHFFMMGDNRDNSQDLRVLSEVGYVPFENFEGRAEIIFFSIDENASGWKIWEWPTRCVGTACSSGSDDHGMRRDPGLEALETRIGYVFRDQTLLVLALTHVSAAGAARARVKSYQRLEFLGDRVLGLAIASLLYDNFPSAEEGDLSKRLTDLVRRESCAALAEAGGSPSISGSARARRMAEGDRTRRSSATSPRRSSAPCSSMAATRRRAA